MWWGEKWCNVLEKIVGSDNPTSISSTLSNGGCGYLHLLLAYETASCCNIQALQLLDYWFIECRMVRDVITRSMDRTVVNHVLHSRDTGPQSQCGESLWCPPERNLLPLKRCTTVRNRLSFNPVLSDRADPSGSPAFGRTGFAVLSQLLFQASMNPKKKKKKRNRTAACRGKGRFQS